MTKRELFHKRTALLLKHAAVLLVYVQTIKINLTKTESLFNRLFLGIP